MVGGDGGLRDLPRPVREGSARRSGGRGAGWAKTAEWGDDIHADWRDAVVQLYGGDLRGVVEHLDHLESLGVNLDLPHTVLPARRPRTDTTRRPSRTCRPAARRRRRARCADRRSAPSWHQVIGDLTTNHSGSEHEWFQRRVADATRRRATFYFFDHHPDDYVQWFGVPTLPEVRPVLARAATAAGRGARRASSRSG
jgi:alpha-glucosidase